MTYVYRSSNVAELAGLPSLTLVRKIDNETDELFAFECPTTNVLESTGSTALRVLLPLQCHFGAALPASYGPRKEEIFFWFLPSNCCVKLLWLI